jgi:protein-L-isoaspartate O-methyltransferase
VPRHLFIPDVIWREVGSGDLVSVSRSDDPDRWCALVEGNDSVITQVDDGHPARPGAAGWMPTSSVSMPKMVAVMLTHLDAQPGHRVLEIGTGTGWNAALLAHLLGAEQVSTVEIHPGLATHAREALCDAGFGGVVVITADGAFGYPHSAPYDQQRIPRARLRDILGPAPERAALPTTWTDIHPNRVAGRFEARLAIGLRVPECKFIYSPYDVDDDEQQRRGAVWFFDPWSRSWASLTHLTPDASDDHFAIQQQGPRQLWDEIEAAYQWWIDAGRPGVDQWRFTVTPEGQRIELD